MITLKKLKKPTKRDIKIYAVDDDIYYRNLILANLKKLGFSDVKAYTKGEDCILDIKNDKPDVILLDYVLKEGMNGDEILKIIKNIHSDIEVIILSGLEDIDIATSVINYGASDYVVKNKLSFFNIGNTLKNIDKIINLKELDVWRSKRNTSLGILLGLGIVSVILETITLLQK